MEVFASSINKTVDYFLHAGYMSATGNIDGPPVQTPLSAGFFGDFVQSFNIAEIFTLIAVIVAGIMCLHYLRTLIKTQKPGIVKSRINDHDGLQ